MGDSKLISNIEPGPDQDSNKPLTDEICCETSPIQSIEDTINCDGSFDAEITVSSREPFLTCRTSPSVVGRTVAIVTTTGAEKYSTFTTVQACSVVGMEPGDSGFSSWTGAFESNSHFSPTLARLDSEGYPPGSEVSSGQSKMPNLRLDGATDLMALCCANALNEELCDRMFVGNLAHPSNRATSDISRIPPWHSEGNSAHSNPKPSSVSTVPTSQAAWSPATTRDGLSSVCSGRAQSPFRPVKFLETEGFSTHDEVMTPHLHNVPYRPASSANSINTPQQPVAVNGCTSTNSTAICSCHYRSVGKRPDSAPVRIGQSSSNGMHFPAYATDSDSVSDRTDDVPIDTANDGDDEGDTVSTPTSHRRQRKQQQSRSRLSRHSFSGPNHSALVQPTQSCVDRSLPVRSRGMDVQLHSPVPCASVFCLRHHLSSNTEYRVQPLWLRRHRIPPPLPVLSSIGQQCAVQDHVVFADQSTTRSTGLCSTSPRHGRFTRLGNMMHTIPPMPDVVPQDSHRVCLHTLHFDSTSPTGSSVLFSPTRPISSQRIDSIQQNPRCASVPLGSTETRRLCTTHPYSYDHDQCRPLLYLDPLHNPYPPPHTVGPHSHREISVRQSTSGPMLCDPVGTPSQLSLFAQRMAHIGDELVEQGRSHIRTRYSMSTDGIRTGAPSTTTDSAHSLWNLSSSLASMVVAPFDYVHRILELASQSLTETSRRTSSSPAPIRTSYDTAASIWRRRRRAQTYAGGVTQPNLSRVSIPSVSIHHSGCECLCRGCRAPWEPTARTSTPALGRSHFPVSPNSPSCIQSNSPTDENQTTDYIFHFE